MKIASAYSFDHVRISPQKQIPCHTQESWELSYVAEGSGTCLVGDVSFPFSSGCLVFIPPGISHCWHFDAEKTAADGNIENLTLMYEDEYFDRVAAAFPELAEKAEIVRSSEAAVSFPPSVSAGICVIMSRMCSEEVPERTVSSVSVLLRLADSLRHMDDRSIIRVKPLPGQQEIRLDRVRTYVSCNYSRRISISEIAEYVGMNRAAFCRFFRMHTGKTFVRYLNEYRVKKAASMLGKEGCTVSEAGYSCGFSDLSHFSRMFRLIAGDSPSSVKKKEGIRICK